MGVVYLASDTMLGRQVAIKLLNPKYTSRVALHRLQREVQMQAQLEHPNVVRVYDAGHERTMFFVMEYVERVHFGELLASTKLPERLHIIAQACNGLAYAHGRHLIHRDVKPQNVLVSVNSEAKLGDFGVGRVVEEQSRLTREGMTVGSVHFMAPEQGSGKPVDHRTDLYSVGVMLYLASTNRLPFIGRQHEVISQHLHAQPKASRKIDPAIPEELESLICHLLEKKPDKRPPSAEVVRAELERLHTAYWPIMSEVDPKNWPGG